MLINNKGLQRFIDAQKNDYETALNEVKQGSKCSHWMWYIFPQVQGLGFSLTSNYYAIDGRTEAEAYLKHPVLGNRLIEICKELLKLPVKDAALIFGSPDNLKLRSSLTLFAAVNDTHPVFKEVLGKYFDGVEDARTAEILNRSKAI